MKKEPLPKVASVYRVPLKKVFNQTHVNGETWNSVYAHVRCLKCKKPFKEGEAYEVVVIWKKRLGAGIGEPISKYQHVECP